mmetsp:Transcript_4340/g.16267  ORF Transcript_4340/g.16267 Transcript_4340/m.16267 type:complete len:228 (+) Transcript_4340:2511-3194(+)
MYTQSTAARVTGEMNRGSLAQNARVIALAPDARSVLVGGFRRTLAPCAKGAGSPGRRQRNCSSSPDPFPTSAPALDSTSSGGVASTTSAALDSHASLAFVRHVPTCSAVSEVRVWNSRSGLPNESIIAPINLGLDSAAAGIPVSSTHSFTTASNISRRTAAGSIPSRFVRSAFTPASAGSGWPLGPLKTPRNIATPSLLRRRTSLPSEVSSTVSTPSARLSCAYASP